MDTQLLKSDSFYQHTFKNISIGKDILENKEFEECIFEKCSFVEMTFKNCRFIQSSFKESVLSAIKPIDCSFLEVKFDLSKVIGFDWTLAKTIRFLEFVDSQINYSNFSGLKLHNTKIIKCIAQEVDFSEADLTDSDFQQTDLEKSRFLNTNLTKADFRKAMNYSIDFHFNTLKQAKFSLPEALSFLKYLEIDLKD